MRMDTEPAVPRRTWSSPLRGWAEAEGLQRHEDKLLLVLTLLIGAVVGLVVVAFIVATESLAAWFYPANGPGWRRLVIPTAGALLTGVLLARYFPNARGSGIPQTKTALFLNRGYIRLSTVLGKFGCSLLSLASGIALGREGPTVQVGAGIASVLGRRLGLGPRRVQALVPIGTSAALAAAFNTPIAAVLFTLEEILGDLHAPVLGSIVISSATSWAVLHLVLGDEPLFHVPAYQLVHPIELPVYVVLGVAGGLVSVAFVKLLLGMRRRFLALPVATQWWQPVVGGLVVGVLGWFVPDVLGVGYDHVGDALNGKLVLGAMALLLVLKLVATATAYASGNAGGIFGPSLFIGAMLGGAVGSLAHAEFPDVTGSAGAYALVGMGTAFAGIVRAPMTSVIMIFEITRDYSIIVPVMIANLLSYFISQRLQPEPVYEALLHQDHIQLPPPRAQISGLTVEQAMRAPAEVAGADERVADRLAQFGPPDGHLKSDAWPVVDAGRFLGMITRPMLREAAQAGHSGDRLGDLLRMPEEPVTADAFPHVHVDQGVDAVLQRMGRAGLDVLPVVSRTDVHHLLGVVALSDMPHAYGSADDGESAVDAHVTDATSGRTLLAVVIAGVIGLFLLGGFLTHHYNSARLEQAAGFYQDGNALLRDGQVAEAIEQFRAALSMTHSDEYRLALGLALARADRGAEANLYLSEVVRSDPNNGPANLAMAHLFRAEDNRAAAVSSYRQGDRGRLAEGRAATEDRRRLRTRRPVPEGRRPPSGGGGAAAAHGPDERSGRADPDRPWLAGRRRARSGGRRVSRDPRGVSGEWGRLLRARRVRARARRLPSGAFGVPAGGAPRPHRPVRPRAGGPVRTGAGPRPDVNGPESGRALRTQPGALAACVVRGGGVPGLRQRPEPGGCRCTEGARLVATSAVARGGRRRQRPSGYGSVGQPIAGMRRPRP